MNKALKIFFTVVFIGTFTHSQTLKPETQSKDLRLIMDEMSQNFLKLRLFAHSDKNFLDVKNRQEISSLLKQVTTAAKEVHKKEQIKNNNYSISGDALVDHLRRTQDTFDSGQPKFARWMVTSTQFVCMSCHTQFPAYDRKFSLTDEQKNLLTDFEQAEFLFASRDFAGALVIFEKIVGNSDKYPAMDVDKSAERIAIYYSRIARDFPQAIASFEKFLKNELTPKYLNDQFKQWIKQYQFLNSLPQINPKLAPESDIFALLKSIKKAETFSKDGAPLVINQYQAGLLYEYLNTNPTSKRTPEILYNLAIFDSLLDDNFFFSLTDIYLKDCVVRFPKSKIAQRCFSELENRIELSFTGSRGTSIPADVRSELNRLKKHLKKKK